MVLSQRRIDTEWRRTRLFLNTKNTIRYDELFIVQNENRVPIAYEYVRRLMAWNSPCCGTPPFWSSAGYRPCRTRRACARVYARIAGCRSRIVCVFPTAHCARRIRVYSPAPPPAPNGPGDCRPDACARPRVCVSKISFRERGGGVAGRAGEYCRPRAIRGGYATGSGEPRSRPFDSMKNTFTNKLMAS